VAVRRRSARSARGQHVLRSSRLAAALVRDAGVTRGDLVVDIGAGTGVLTRALLDSGARVVAVERDPSLAAGLRDRFRGEVAVVETDILAWRFPDEPFAVVANLPFAGSGAILSELLRERVTGADVIVEWGFAEKHAAVWPATLKGAYWRAFYDVELARRLDRSAFAPPPGVDAAVLRFTRRAVPLVPATESQRYWRFLSKAFRARAEVRRSVLTPLQTKRLAATLGFRHDAQPRDLDAYQWAGVFTATQGSAAATHDQVHPRAGE
jgi:23S rRNA (adenine-N6)-dimethyltransferase